MLRSRIAVLLSWLVTTLVLGMAIFSTPYMRRVLRGEAVESAGESIAGIIIVASICGWPWLKALALSSSPENQRRHYVFSALAVALACMFYLPISRGQDFSIGLYTIFCVLCIWVAYPLTRLAADK